MGLLLYILFVHLRAMTEARNPIGITVEVANVSYKAFESAVKLIALDVLLWDKEKREQQFKCVGYEIKDNELYLYKYSDTCIKFAYEYNLQQSIDFAWGWWENNKKPTAREPDTDGSTEVAWFVRTKREGDFGKFLSVKPIWFIYGK